jgi:hypothetical protein
MKTKTLERLLITFGVLMIFIYTLARVQGFILSRIEIDKFKSRQLLAQEFGLPGVLTLLSGLGSRLLRKAA